MPLQPLPHPDKKQLRAAFIATCMILFYCYSLMIPDLANALFLFILLPNHIVHLVQALSSLFVRLQLHLAVLKGCLEKQKHTYNPVFVLLRSGAV